MAGAAHRHPRSGLGSALGARYPGPPVLDCRCSSWELPVTCEALMASSWQMLVPRHSMSLTLQASKATNHTAKHCMTGKALS